MFDWFFVEEDNNKEEEEKRGAKEQPGMQSSVVTRGMKNRPTDVNAVNNQAEIPN
jgi:hypothetical protein